MNELNTLEITLLKGLIEKYPMLKPHLDVLKVSNRKSTGTGLIVTFEYENADLEFNETNALFSNEENIEIKKLKKGLNYVIDITMGRIETLELSTYEEKWDGVIGEFKLVENINPPIK